MTEQEKSSAVVDETREAWKPRHSQLIPRKSKNGAALVLSAVAIAIALAAGIGLYGWKQQATAQTETSDALATQLTALQRRRRAKKRSWKGLSKNKRRS